MELRPSHKRLSTVLFFQWTIKNQAQDAVINYGCKSFSNKQYHKMNFLVSVLLLNQWQLYWFPEKVTKLILMYVINWWWKISVQEISQSLQKLIVHLSAILIFEKKNQVSLTKILGEKSLRILPSPAVIILSPQHHMSQTLSFPPLHVG